MSTDTQILLPSDFNLNKISLSDPKGPDNKAKTVYVNYGGSKFIFQTPEMPMPFGLSKWDNEGKGPVKYSVDLSFKEKDSRKSVEKFFEMISALDELAVETAIKNKSAWFKGKKYTDEMIPTLYTPSIKYAKDKKTKEITYDFPATFKTVLPYNDQEKTITTRIYDTKKNPINIFTLDNTKGARSTLIVQCAGIWISTTGFGLSWKAIQMRIVPPTTIKEYAFAPTEDDNLAEESDVDEEEQQQAHKKQIGGSGPHRGEENNVSAGDEDNDFDNSGEDEHPPASKATGRGSAKSTANSGGKTAAAASAKKKPVSEQDMLDDDDEEDEDDGLQQPPPK